MRYDNRTAVIVGGTHGMGLATASLLAAGGARVLVTGRDPRRIEEARAILGGRAEVIGSDAADMGEVARLGDVVERRLGPVDLLHVNVGVAELEPFEAVSEASYDRQFAVNAKGPFFTVQRLAPAIREGGAIVMTSSVAETGGTPGMSVYGASKAALAALASTFAAELLPRGIRVNVVSPGFIDTPTKGVAGLSVEERDAFKRLGDAVTPMKRNGTAEEVARAVLFLAFEATFTTGARLAVDGGLGQRLAPAGH